MPQPFERYNRFMKYLNPSWSNDKNLDEGNGWMEITWDTKCEVCGETYKRNTMKLRDGKVRCEDCLNAGIQGPERPPSGEAQT